MKAKKILGIVLLFLSVLAVLAYHPPTVDSQTGTSYDRSPRFKHELLKKVITKDSSGKIVTLYDPRDPYAIFINYELGMHCVGFDVSYCCVIPPYNSVQAQAIKTGEKGVLPRLLSPEDGVKLTYSIRDNSYSEGNKMRYWQVVKDVYGNGKMDDPGDNMANYVWTHLFIYKDLEGTVPPIGPRRKGFL